MTAPRPSDDESRREHLLRALLERVLVAAGGDGAQLIVQERSQWVSSVSIGVAAGSVQDRDAPDAREAQGALTPRSLQSWTPARSALLRLNRAIVHLQAPRPMAITQITAAFDAAGPLDSVLQSHFRSIQVEGMLGRAEHALRAAQARASVDRHLIQCARDGGGLAALVRECSRLTGKAVTLFDQDGGRTMSVHMTASPVPTPALAVILGALGYPSPDDDHVHTVAAALAGPLSRRELITPVFANGETFGWLVIEEHPSTFVAVDEHALASTARLLSHEYVVQKRVARVAWNARSSLTRQLVRRTRESADLAASAEYLGVNVDASRVVVYVQDAIGLATTGGADRDLASCVERQLGIEVLATRGSDGLMLLVEAPEHLGALTNVARVKTALREASSTVEALRSAIVGVSSVCTAATLARGYREAREVALCIDRFARLPEHRVMAVDDLGPARLFLANSSITAVTHYVDDVLGPLLTGGPGTADLLLTTQHYFDSSRSVRATGARLGLHENTIRLRLARVHNLTGLNVAADANDQLSVQTALSMLRLLGHPALPSFDSCALLPDTVSILA